MINKDQFFYLYTAIYLGMFYVSILYSIAYDLTGFKFKQKNIENYIAILLVLSIAFIVGLRDISVGTDTNNYYRFWWLSSANIADKKDFLMYLWMMAIRYFTGNYQYFLLLNSLLFSFLFLLSTIKISKNTGTNILFIIFAYYSMFFMRSIEINIVRQGLALASLLLSYQYLVSERKRASILYAIASIFFHYTSIIPIVLFYCMSLTKRLSMNFFMVLYLVFLTLAFMGLGLKDFAPYLSYLLEGDRRISYLYTESTKYRIGFRIDFALFNSFFLLIFLFINKAIKDPNYEELLIYYILSSCVFFLSFQIPYSDRMGLFSWFVIPLLFSPLLRNSFNKKYKSVAVMVLFSIFLFFQ